MSEEEKLEIISIILSSLRTNAKTINQLPETAIFGAEDFIELSTGKKIPLEVVKTIFNKEVLERIQELWREIESIGTGAHLIKTGDTTEPTDSNAFSALRVLSMFLRKDQPEQMNHLMRFGEFIDSMLAGKGTGIFPDGRIQTDKLEVRGAMVVKELIFNRWKANEGNDTYSECGVIEKIEKLKDGTYNLYLRKRWENDMTAFDVDDVCFGSVNDLMNSGKYYDSWFRILHVEPLINKLNVILYPNGEVPSEEGISPVNYEPRELMTITRRGNANPTKLDRQSFWYVSSYEGCICMLDGVTKPILEESNYSIIVGKLKHLSVFTHLPINYRQSYIYCRGIATQDMMRVDYQGNPIRSERHRGEWSLQTATDEPYKVTATTYDVVTHYGCEWACLTDGTKTEPKYASQNWLMLRGNPKFSIDILSSEGWYFDHDRISRKDEGGQWIPFTTLRVEGELFNQPVTDKILDSDITWSRNTGNPTEDDAWNTKRIGAGKSISISVDDLGPEYMKRTSCTFKATALLRDGQQVEVAEQYVTF